MKNLIEKYILDHITPEPEVLSELYRETHCRVMNPNMISGHLQGTILGMIIKMTDPLNVLEIGTYTGYSAISMAMAIKPEGTVYTIERDDELEGITRKYFEKSGMAGKIRSYTGDALHIIPTLTPVFDLVFIDGDKREYCDYFNTVFSKVRVGGFIIADNILWDGKVADPTVNDKMTSGIREFNHLVANDSRTENSIIPVRDGQGIIISVS
ncbi:MAG: O-methyltransferase [Bacteroidales bacterium]|nr:O-methyltransferase [Bacteroidales bacterium]